MSTAMGTSSGRRTLVLIAAGLALADTSIVTLALPQLLHELDTTIEGVAAVLAVYTAVLALALPFAARLARRHGAAAIGAAGLTVFGLASLGCGLVDALAPLLVLRGVQAAGGALTLVAAFELLEAGAAHGRGRWAAIAVVGTALGPALGGTLTQLFDWRAIFLVQAPFALAAAVAALTLREGPLGQPARVGDASPDPAVPPAVPERMPARPAVALALVSAALTSVLFLLVLLLVAGWDASPIAAAAALMAMPVAAFAAIRVGGAYPPAAQAALGSALVGLGVLACAVLPAPSVWVTLPAQVLAGAGMGLALPALAGGLLPERTIEDAARLLTVRHAAIAVTLLALGPIVAADLDGATERAQQEGVAVVLDAPLPISQKISLAPKLLAGVTSQRPRAGLHESTARAIAGAPADDRAALHRVGDRIDDALVRAVASAFRHAFLITGALALLAVLVLGVPAAVRRRTAALAAAAALVPVASLAVRAAVEPPAVQIQDPCHAERAAPTGGLDGLIQGGAMVALDRAACSLGSSREELVLALADEHARERFEREHGTDPRSLGALLQAVLG